MKLHFLAATLLVTGQAASAQVFPEPGFQTQSVFPAPSAFGTYATLSNGNVFSFDGQLIELYTEDGTLIQSLGSLPTSTFASFAILDPTESFGVIGESSNGEIWTVDLAGGGMNLLTTLAFNYDARFDIDPNFLWVSAATAGFGGGNDIVRVEMASGNSSFVAHVPGPSGPLDVDAAGDLYYATIDPNFAAFDGTDLLRWDRADLLSGNLLGVADATLVTDLLDGASSLRVGPVGGQIFLTETNISTGVNRLIEIDATSGNVLDLITEIFVWPGNIELFAGSGPGTFHEFQPSNVELVVSTTDFGNAAQDRARIVPQRPSATLSGPSSGPGAMTLTFENCEPNAAILLYWGAIGDYQANELQFNLGFGAPFHSAFAMNKIRRLPILTPTDANGTATFPYYDPGSLHGTLAFQAVVMAPSTALLGSTAAVTN